MFTNSNKLKELGLRISEIQLNHMTDETHNNSDYSNTTSSILNRSNLTTQFKETKLDPSQIHSKTDSRNNLKTHQIFKTCKNKRLKNDYFENNDNFLSSSDFQNLIKQLTHFYASDFEQKKFEFQTKSKIISRRVIWLFSEKSIF